MAFDVEKQAIFLHQKIGAFIADMPSAPAFKFIAEAQVKVEQALQQRFCVLVWMAFPCQPLAGWQQLNETRMSEESLSQVDA